MKTIRKDAFVAIKQGAEKGVENHKDDVDSKDSISHRLLSFIYRLDTEFPLSGGETQEDMRGSVDYMQHEAHALLSGVDANFPLSGGE